MSDSSDLIPVPESQSYSRPPFDRPSRHEVAADDPHREINERRARVENSELLRNLRGL